MCSPRGFPSGVLMPNVAQVFNDIAFYHPSPCATASTDGSAEFESEFTGSRFIRIPRNFALTKASCTP
jgi:hypothetical protein